MEIGPLKPELCDQAARLHMLYLSTPFRGMAGQKLLTRYYQAVCLGQGASGFMAHSDGKLLGYVCGIWDPIGLRTTLLRNHWFAIALWGFCQVLSRPVLLNDFLGRFYTVRGPNGDLEQKGHRACYELRPIVVSPNLRGSGLAQQLVERLTRDARLRGFRSICLYAEQGNVIAKRFYKAFGFHEVSRTRLRQKEHLYFELAFT